MWKAIKLRFTSPLHLSRGRDEYDKSETLYHSDSLKAAIYAVGLPYFAQWSNWQNFAQAVRISSCFPYAGDELFLPKPVLKKKIHFTGILDDLQSKKVKKVEYIEKSQFVNFLNAPDEWKVDSQLLQPDGRFICRSAQTFTKIENGKSKTFDFFKTDVQQRVKVPLEGETDTKGNAIESKPYYVDRMYFNENCGLYFIAEFMDANIEQQFLKALKILGEQGIGTDRSVGNGFFEFDETLEIQDFQLQMPSNLGLQMPLGLYLPTKEEHQAIDFDQSHWGLMKRGGFMAGSTEEKLRHLWKNDIFMFAEGSVFKAPIALKGKYENLQPLWDTDEMHPVWRDGQCLMLTI